MAEHGALNPGTVGITAVALDGSVGRVQTLAEGDELAEPGQRLGEIAEGNQLSMTGVVTESGAADSRSHIMVGVL
ncbi:hypothetical protein SDC9_210762 [bioreactor metagenome]|uniref:Uncharacterized protein n=1 Tax=bioreactor metagenome TaxID=1076179 RepID=A0A645JH29_9ZZZZ